jgi:REP element-mobilizing transposase RayT
MKFQKKRLSIGDMVMIMANPEEHKEHDRLMEEFQRRVRQTVSSKEYQKWAESVYRKNKALIKELVEWRALYRIKIQSDEDQSVSYLISRVKAKYRITWRGKLDEIKEKAFRESKGMPRNFLNLCINDLYAEEVKKDIKKGGKKIPGNRQLAKPQLERLLKNIEDSRKFMIERQQEGTEIRLFPVAPEYLPIWYFIARPENEFYRNEFLEKGLEPLIRHEKAEDAAKLRSLNEINALFKKYTYKKYYQKTIYPKLKQIADWVKEEYALRDKIRREAGISVVDQHRIRIKELIHQQEEEWDRLKSLIINNIEFMPDKKTQDELREAYRKVKDAIDEELKHI